MKRFLPLALIACVAGASAAEPTDAPPRAALPAAASVPAAPASWPGQSPAVRQAQTAVAPGKVRPEHAVVPQIRLPLRPAAPPAAAADAAPGGGLDERAARCAALVDKAERLRCESGGQMPPR